MILVAVPAGDPVGGRHDVDARLEHFHVQIFVGEDTVKGQHIGFGGDDLVDGAGGRHPVGCQSGELTRVTTDLFRCVAMQSDQLQIGLGGDAFDHLCADVARRDLEDPDRLAGFAHSVRPFCAA